MLGRSDAQGDTIDGYETLHLCGLPFAGERARSAGDEHRADKDDRKKEKKQPSDRRRFLASIREDCFAGYKLLIIDSFGYAPLSQTGAELLFEVFSQRYEPGSTVVTSNLPFDEWTSMFGSERLTGALLDRLTHHVHILELNTPADSPTEL